MDLFLVSKILKDKDYIYIYTYVVYYSGVAEDTTGIEMRSFTSPKTDDVNFATVQRPVMRVRKGRSQFDVILSDIPETPNPSPVVSRLYTSSPATLPISNPVPIYDTPRSSIASRPKTDGIVYENVDSNFQEISLEKSNEERELSSLPIRLRIKKWVETRDQNP